jgi:hypothetical protein
MLTIKQKKAVLIVTAIIAILAWGPSPASANSGAGIWTYNHAWSIALVNLTEYPLTYLRHDEPGAFAYPTWYNTYWCVKNDVYQDMLDAGDDWQVEPYRTKVWVGDKCSNIAPSYWDGRMTLYLVGHQECSFDLVFQSQKAHNLAEHGNWTGLSPHGPGPGQGWAPAGPDLGQFAYGRWVTPVDDYKMHNVMTLISSKFMVTLYSGDNNNLVVVVQQLYGEDPTTKALLWDDSYAYKGYPLDFVDNDNYATPH